jgi:hypothetical protein
VNSREKYQKPDGKTDPVYAGLTAAEWLNMYNFYLKTVDAKSTIVEASGKLGEYIDRGISFLGDVLATFTNIGFNFFLSSADTDIKEEQTLHSNKNFGSDPTHTQLAKDSPDHPLNPLAVKLAKAAVRDVAQRIIKAWSTQSDPSGEELANYVINKYTIHPKSSKADWVVKIVKDWGNDNPKIIKRLESPTVSGHVHSETQRVISDKKVQEIFNYFK